MAAWIRERETGSPRRRPTRSRVQCSPGDHLSLLGPRGPSFVFARRMRAMNPDRPVPADLQALGTTDASFETALAVVDLPAGAMRRITRGDLDILLAHTPVGIVATDDRCPHMSAPLSIGVLDECVVACPLHEGRFDLATGDVVQMPTTGGLDSDGRYHPTWSPAGGEPRPTRPARRPRRAGSPASAACAFTRSGSSMIGSRSRCHRSRATRRTDLSRPQAPSSGPRQP